MKQLKFRRNYNHKLHGLNFTSIRPANGYLEAGESVEIVLLEPEPLTLGRACISNCIRCDTIQEIPLLVYMTDIGALTKDQGMRLLRKFYPNLENYTGWMVWFLTWEERYVPVEQIPLNALNVKDIYQLLA